MSEREMDRYRIDSHKLIYHVGRVNEWLGGKITYPIYMEISPSGACNHRCVYCGLDFMGYEPRFLDTVLLEGRLSELGKLGLKSVMYAGEGEPFLHSDMARIIKHTKSCGIDVGVTTNGVLLNNRIAGSILGSAEWIKVGLDAGTSRTYARIHGCDPKDFDKVIENISAAVRIKKDNNYPCTIGVQLLLLPDNHREVAVLAKLVRDIGVDYLVVKPYSQHPKSKTKVYSDIKYEDYAYIAEELDKFKTDCFSVILRQRAMAKWDKGEKHYKRCLAFPFWSYIDSAGNVWGCSVYIGDRRFLYGNIYGKSFKEIWEGEDRMQSLRWAREELDVSNCRINCRMDEANRYLWDITNPPEHVNFI